MSMCDTRIPYDRGYVRVESAFELCSRETYLFYFKDDKRRTAF